jgi:hypothetical protein
LISCPHYVLIYFCARNFAKPSIHILYEPYVYDPLFGPSDGAVNGHVTGCYRARPEIGSYSNRLQAGPTLRAQYENRVAFDGPYLTWASVCLLGRQLATRQLAGY